MHQYFTHELARAHVMDLQREPRVAARAQQADAVPHVDEQALATSPARRARRALASVRRALFGTAGPSRRHAEKSGVADPA
jgi:hypothetical protein